VVGLLETGEFQERARVLGERLRSRLESLTSSRGITEVRTVGLWAGVDLDPAVLSGRQAAEGLAQRGVLAKETHDITIRFAPPLIITDEELDWMLDQFEAVLDAATAAH
jgi:ornithine--oxo-acid transaminase